VGGQHRIDRGLRQRPDQLGRVEEADLPGFGRERAGIVASEADVTQDFSVVS
jgi:hypothetical protein